MHVLLRSRRIYQLMELLVKNAPLLTSLTCSFAVSSVSHGRYWHFTANLLFYTNFNARSVIRCGRGVEFQPPSSSFSLGYSSPLPVLWKSSFPLQNPRGLIFLTHHHRTHHRTLPCTCGALCSIANKAMRLCLPGLATGTGTQHSAASEGWDHWSNRRHRSLRGLFVYCRSFPTRLITQGVTMYYGLHTHHTSEIL